MLLSTNRIYELLVDEIIYMLLCVTYEKNKKT